MNVSKQLVRDQYKRSLFVLFGTVLMMVLLAFAGLIRVVQAAPGVPRDPVRIYNEDFENNHSTSPILLTSYTGVEGVTYTAAAPWLTSCNGEVIYFAMDNSEFDNSNCSVGDGTNSSGAFDYVRRMAHALGQFGGATDPTLNRALIAYTDNGNVSVNPGANLVQLETAQSINLPNNNRRFLIASLSAASVNCELGSTHPAKFIFYLLDGSDTRRINQDALNVCTDEQSQQITPPSLQSNSATSPSVLPIWVAKIQTDRALLSQANSVGVRVVNEEGDGIGNDNALDDISISDASPHLDITFEPDTVEIDKTSRMTFTVTNTSDLLAKEGWSFTNNLPESLMVAENPDIQTTCTAGSIIVSEDKRQLAYAGNLNLGQVSCTLTISVTSKTAQTYINGPALLANVVGLQLPEDAPVTFVPFAPNTGTTNTNFTYYVGIAGAGAIAIGLHRKLKKLRRRA